MWAFVHDFPDGYRPNPKLTIARGSTVTVERAGGQITKVIVENGTVDLLNIPAPPGGSEIKDAPAMISPSAPIAGRDVHISVLAPEVILSATQERDKFGVEASAVELKPGVKITSATVVKYFAPSALNKDHVKWIARSEKASSSAFNFYAAFWSLVISIVTNIVVSLATTPKPESELKDLVMGLTQMPDEGPCAWYHNPKLWVAVVAVALVTVNIIFW